MIIDAENSDDAEIGDIIVSPTNISICTSIVDGYDYPELGPNVAKIFTTLYGEGRLHTDCVLRKII